MKKSIFFFAILLFVGGVTRIGFCQNPPPPPGGGHGQGSNEPSGAPVGDGFALLITLSAAYTLKKLYYTRRVKNEN